MYVRLKVVVHRKLDGPGYLAVCPELQGCHAEGDTVGTALDNLQDVARVLIELRKADGLPVPEPSVQAGAAMDGVLAVNLTP